jgi:hypothetical protein
MIDLLRRSSLPGAAALAAAAFFLFFFFAPALAQTSGVPTGAIITGNATGSTAAVTGTLAAVANKTTYICGFSVSSTGSAAVSPITVAGIVGSSMVFQNLSAGAGILQQAFYPCVPASAPNTAITVTTTADGTATAVNVNSWGFLQ